MITYVQGDMFASSAIALVNPVNTVRVMGAGLAKQFAQRYPNMLDGYRDACRSGQLTTGRVHVHRAADGHLIFNVPSKKHWRDPSRIEYIADVMPAIVNALVANGVESIAIPPLGCGLGGLQWSQVEPIIVGAFASHDEIFVELYARRSATTKQD